MALKRTELYFYILFSCMWLFASPTFIPKSKNIEDVDISSSNIEDIPLQKTADDIVSRLNFEENPPEVISETGKAVESLDLPRRTNNYLGLLVKTKIFRNYEKLPLDENVKEDRKNGYNKDNDPQYPVDYDLSYARFQYRNISLTYKAIPKSDLNVTLTVVNVGDSDGGDICQCYMSWGNKSLPVPRQQLVYFDNFHMPGQSNMIYEFTLNWMSWAYWNNGNWTVQTGNNTICCGDQPPFLINATNVVCSQFQVYGF